MSKKKTTGTKRWVVTTTKNPYDKHLTIYYASLGGFNNSAHDSRYQAQIKCELLNKQDGLE